MEKGTGTNATPQQYLFLPALFLLGREFDKIVGEKKGKGARATTV